MKRPVKHTTGDDHFDPATPDRAEPVVYLARFGPVLSDELADLKYGIVYHWSVDTQPTFIYMPYILICI